MALMAVALPILPGKTGAWRAWLAEMQPGGARHAEFVASRRQIGTRERTFLQQTPMGDLVIVTVEGDDPAGAMTKFFASRDEFALWFFAMTKEFHGVDLSQGMPGPPPELIIDTAG